jgi:anthranilate phosphoribosyltransferase
MTSELLTRSIDAVASGHDLSFDESAAVLAEIMSGYATEVQIAGFLIALRCKGETVDELAGLAKTMRSFATPVNVSRDDLLDTAGTGGGRRTFNVSTTAALIAAAAGCAVAKHGNRSSTGISGSADLLEALGAAITLEPDQVARCIDEVGFGFMFAPAHHQATRFVVPVRKQLAVRTIFNFLGPLTNPAGAARQVIGVSDPAFVEKMARALAVLGVTRALVVNGDDGVDEFSISAPTTVVEVDGDVRQYSYTPEEAGLNRHDAAEVPGGDPHQNAAITLAIFKGSHGAARDLAVLNAGAAIYAAGRAGSIADGARAAEAALDSGAALALVERFCALTKELEA